MNKKNSLNHVLVMPPAPHATLLAWGAGVPITLQMAKVALLHNPNQHLFQIMPLEGWIIVCLSFRNPGFDPSGWQGDTRTEIFPGSFDFRC